MSTRNNSIYLQDISTLPHLKSAPHPVFMRECRDALQLCNNMTTFKYTAAVPYFLSTFIPSLLNKTRLKDLRLNCNISSSAAKLLAKITHLNSLSLEFASWNVTQVLLPWMASVSTTLNSLTFYVGCAFKSFCSIPMPFLDDQRSSWGCLERHSSMLAKSARSSRSWMFQAGPFRRSQSSNPHATPWGSLIDNNSEDRSIWYSTIHWSHVKPDDSPVPDFLFSPSPPLRHLKHLALDSRLILQPLPTPSSFATVLRLLRPSAPPLVSFSLKLPEKKFELNEEVITQLIESHAFTLRRVAFIDCGVGPESIEKICISCIHLEELALSVPTKELVGFFFNEQPNNSHLTLFQLPFAQRLSQSSSLHTLIDLENHIEHGVRIPIDRDSARYLMSLSASLRKVVTTTDTFIVSCTFTNFFKRMTLLIRVRW